ncbi:hypothetical protein KP509_33G002700 [Ceratopteris richardii]|nr:hypothetical protein KP509_33G002700 [Ceratopteris richardii]
MLVDMYSKCGFMEKAQEVFDGLTAKNVVTWNALIGGYAKQDHGEEALRLVQRMEMEGIQPDQVTILCQLKACVSIKTVSEGGEIHAEIVRRNLLEQHPFIGNALIDMYAKCGLLHLAQEILFQLPFRDVNSWNALITGYVKQEHCNGAFICFEQMQIDGILPDVVTLVFSLKACGISQNNEKGRMIHAAIETQERLRTSIILGNALVDMYGKCGMTLEAEQVFEKLPICDIVSWNALATGYALNACFEKVLICYKRMRYAGVSPDAIAFAYSLNACGSIGYMEKGRKIHAEIKREGILEYDILVGNALVFMYASCDCLLKALEVFSQLPSRNIAAYNAIISALLKRDFHQEALKFQSKLQEEGILPNSITFACCLKACGNVGYIDQGMELHAVSARFGYLENEMVLGSSLVEMYAKFGFFRNAEDIFSKLKERDLFLWNALLAGYANHECTEEAFDCFEQLGMEGILPDAVTFTCICKACANINNVRKCLFMHTEMERRGFLQKDIVLGNAVVDMYAKYGLMIKAHEVLKRLPFRNAVTWSALIAGYVKHEENAAALDCIKEMQLENVVPDSITIASSLKAYGSVVATLQGQAIHAEFERRCLLAKDTIIKTALVDMYAKCGHLRLSCDLFQELTNKDVVSWNSLMYGYLDHELWEAVLDCFPRMLLESTFPDAMSYSGGLKSCGATGFVAKGKEIHTRIVKQLLSEDLIVGKALLDMYVKNGLLREAQDVFNNTCAKGLALWNVLMSGYTQSGLTDKVFNIYNKMIEECGDPDPVTFVSVLNACSHTGLLDEASSYFCAMCKSYGYIPTAEHFTCMVDLLGRAGQLENAIVLMNGFPLHPDLAVSTTALSSCRKQGDLLLGKQVFEALSTDDFSMHICMYNLFIEAAR